MAEPLAQSRPKRSRSCIRVLVVDDFHLIADEIANILEANFYDVRVAYSATDALDIAEQFRPHALIADITLPEMDGFQLAARFATLYPKCRLLLMSAGYSGIPEHLNGPQVVSKASIKKEAFQLLEACRESDDL